MAVYVPEDDASVALLSVLQPLMSFPISFLQCSLSLGGDGIIVLGLNICCHLLAICTASIAVHWKESCLWLSLKVGVVIFNENKHMYL